MKKSCLLLLFLFFNLSLLIASSSSDSIRIERIRMELNQLTTRDSSFLSEIDISASRLPLGEVLRNVAKANDVNLCVRDADQQLISCNFKRTRVIDLIDFLCREYTMDIEIVGNIVSIYPIYVLPDDISDLNIAYNQKDSTLFCHFSNVPLINVIRKISGLTGLNVIVPQHLYQTNVSAYIHNMQLEEAINTIASINNLMLSKDRSNNWIFAGEIENTGKPSYVYRPAYTELQQLKIDSSGRISVNVFSANVSEMIREACQKLALNYYVVSLPDHRISIVADQIDFRTFFNILFAGTEYSWTENEGVYLFGLNGPNNLLTSSRIVPIHHRSMEKIVELIPESIKSGLQVIQFPEQNSLILCGDQNKIMRVENFLRSIDKSVPLITIDVMIVDVRKTINKENGISMGLGDAPEKTSGTLSPGFNMNFNSSSINKLINSFNGFGSMNLGRVTPDFYLNIKFLEETGNLELRSTPKLSTLNGHQAKLKSGETRHYKESTTSIIGSQNPMQTDSYTWKSIDANLELTITPFVSSDSTLTLNINIEQTEFTEVLKTDDKEAPPGTTTRSFESILRIKNGEMVLLGGIERNSKNKSSSGLPFIARIPVLRWLFGSSVNNKTDQKLSIFIKPTIIF